MEKSVEAWAADPLCQVSLAELQQRLAKGWRPERAITEPAELPVGKPRDRKRRKHSRFRGVTWNDRHGQWKAQLWHNKTTIFLGYFDDERDAALEWNKAAREKLGTDARLNRV